MCAGVRVIFQEVAAERKGPGELAGSYSVGGAAADHGRVRGRKKETERESFSFSFFFLPKDYDVLAAVRLCVYTRARLITV